MTAPDLSTPPRRRTRRIIYMPPAPIRAPRASLRNLRPRVLFPEESLPHIDEMHEIILNIAIRELPARINQIKLSEN